MVAGGAPGDAAAVFYFDGYLPTYYEVAAAIRTQAAGGGFDANAYVVFDYFSATDFKFAGIDVATQEIVIGHRSDAGWIVDARAPMALKADAWQHVLVAVNGSVVTLQVNGRAALTQTFAPRMIDGVAYGLNKGLVGVASDGARATFDLVTVQVLPPQITRDETETFDDGVANRFTGPQTGSWIAAAGRYASTAAPGDATVDLVDLGIGRGLGANTWLELQTTVRTSATGGIVFDAYSTGDRKFVALDVAGQRVIVGHVTPRGGLVVDAEVTRALAAGTDYTLTLVLNGTSVAVTRRRRARS